MTHFSGNGQPRIPEMKSSSSPTTAASKPNASTRHTGRNGPECASAPNITAAPAANNAAWSNSTVPRSSGTPGRFGSHAGSRIATDPAQTIITRTTVFFHEGFPRLNCFSPATRPVLSPGEPDCKGASISLRFDLAATACRSFPFREARHPLPP